MSSENFITRDLIERLIAEGGGATRLNFSGQQMGRLDLSYLDLSRADFSRADLTGVTLTSARLRGAKLIEANLAGAELNDADLSAADLYKADLQHTNLTGATLRSAYLVDSNLEGAILQHARLPEADLRGASLSGIDLSDADLSGVELSGLDLTGVIWQSDRQPLPALAGTNFYKARLTAAQARLLTDSEANLDGVEITEESLSLPVSSVSLARLAEPLEPVTIQFIATNLADLTRRLATLTTFYTKCWLLAQGRLADLLEYDQTTADRLDGESRPSLTALTYEAGLVNLTFGPGLPALDAALAELFESIELLNGTPDQRAAFGAARVATLSLLERLDASLDEGGRLVLLSKLLPDLLRLSTGL